MHIQERLLKVPIHYLSYDRFPAPKGAAVHIDAFARALAQAFGDIHLTTVASREVQSTQSTSEKRSQYCDRVWHLPISVYGRNLIERVASFRQQILTQWQFADVVHFRSIYEGYQIAKHKSDLCRQIVYEVNGLPSIELKYHYPAVADDQDLLRKLKQQEQTCLEAADLIVTVSSVNAEHLINERGVDPRRIRVIPNGVDTELFSFALPDPVEEDLRVLYVGTLAPWQGIRVAVEAVALFLRDYPVRLTIVGEGRSAQRKSLKQTIDQYGVSEQVQVLSSTKQAELASLYKTHHCAVAPLMANDRNRVQGCCPLKVLEAMASGTTLIASDLEVVRLLARDGIEAILVRPGSAKAIKDAMLRIRNELHLPKRLAAAARRRVKQSFTWQTSQEKLIQAYEDALGMSRSMRLANSARSRSG